MGNQYGLKVLATCLMELSPITREKGVHRYSLMKTVSLEKSSESNWLLHLANKRIPQLAVNRRVLQLVVVIFFIKREMRTAAVCPLCKKLPSLLLIKREMRTAVVGSLCKKLPSLLLIKREMRTAVVGSLCKKLPSLLLIKREMRTAVVGSLCKKLPSQCPTHQSLSRIQFRNLISKTFLYMLLTLVVLIARESLLTLLMRTCLTNGYRQRFSWGSKPTMKNGSSERKSRMKERRPTKLPVMLPSVEVPVCGREDSLYLKLTFICCLTRFHFDIEFFSRVKYVQYACRNNLFPGHYNCFRINIIDSQFCSPCGLLRCILSVNCVYEW